MFERILWIYDFDVFIIGCHSKNESDCSLRGLLVGLEMAVEANLGFACFGAMWTGGRWQCVMGLGSLNVFLFRVVVLSLRLSVWITFMWRAMQGTTEWKGRPCVVHMQFEENADIGERLFVVAHYLSCVDSSCMNHAQDHPYKRTLHWSSRPRGPIVPRTLPGFLMWTHPCLSFFDEYLTGWLN